jgi:serine/threonine protein phosphatase PrpC
MFVKNKLLLRTLDHSVPQMLVISKEIKARDIARHPDRNRLLRVMGIEWDTPKYELSDEYHLSDCQAFLLCTDGFWELIDEKTMRTLLKKSSSVEEWLSLMTDEVEKNGTEQDMDNYTALAIWC